MAGLEAGHDCMSTPTDSVTKALTSICLDENLADVHFIFPEEPGHARLPAHKLVLGIRSCVFKTMFFGSLPESGPDVKIVDINSNIFALILKYMYTDLVEITDENVIPLLHAAQKYELSTLLMECESFLEGAINVQNVCSILNHASFFGMEDLVEDAQTFIEINAADVFKEDGFLFLTQGNFALVLKSEKVGTAEINIFTAAVRWADEQCRKSEKVVNGSNRREVLGDLLYQIRIHLLSMEDFADIVVPSEILTDAIVLQYYKYFTQKAHDLDSITHFVKTRRLEYPPLNVNLQTLTQIPSCTFVQATTCHKTGQGIIGERGIQSLQTMSFYTTLPVKIKQLDFVPTPKGTPDHPKIGHNPCGGFRLEQALVYIDSISEEEIKPLYKGKIPMGLRTSLKFELSLNVGEWTKLSVGVSKICNVCGIMVAPDYNKIPEQYTRNRHGNSIKSPNTKTVSAFGDSFQVATSGQNIINSVKFEKEYPLNLSSSASVSQ